jgi:pimeloyl-ACP methyl ester carboxylesterase
LSKTPNRQKTEIVKEKLSLLFRRSIFPQLPAKRGKGFSMKKVFLLVVVTAIFWATAAAAQKLPVKFDYLGPEMKHFTNKDGRALIYVDEGEKDWKPVLFFSGAATSAQAFYLTEFLRSFRTELKLRVISLERNGFGETEFLAGQTYQDHAENVKQLLDELGITEFAGVAVSGGGPFLEAAAAAMPERVKSLHFAAAFSNSETLPLSSCNAMRKNAKKYYADLTSWIRNPKVWWDLGSNTSINKIPAFQDTANGEGARSFFIRGQMGDPTPAIYEYTMFCNAPAPASPSDIAAPIFMYYGTADKSVPPVHAEFWKKHYPKSVSQTFRLYENEGHDVQYRHWEQILVDISGQGDKLIICRNDKPRLVKAESAEKLLSSGKATLGLCLWQ